MHKIFNKNNIKVNLKTVSKEDAIFNVGKELCNLGYVEEPYINGMFKRELKNSVVIEESYVAIPHASNEAYNFINKTGIVLHHYLDGIKFNDKIVYLVFGIASKEDLHLDILGSIANIFCNSKCNKAIAQKEFTVDELYDLLLEEYNSIFN